MTEPYYVAVDCETHRARTKQTLPRPVCFQFALNGPDGLEVEILHAADAYPVLKTLLEDPQAHLVGANFAFDLGVIHEAWPCLRPLLWAAAEAGRFHDVQTGMKLLDISTTGDLGFDSSIEDGTVSRLDYSLSGIEKRLLGVDRTADKKSEMRKSFGDLEGVPFEQWPERAVQYALDDAVGTFLCWEAMLKRAAPEGYGSMGTEPFQAAVSLPLILATSVGLPVDPEAVRALEAHVEEEIGQDKMIPLYEIGLLTPPEPPKPYAKGTLNLDGTPKMKAGKPEKKNMAAIRERVEHVAAANGKRIKPTAGGQTSTDAATLKALAPYDPALGLLQKREEFAKLRSTFIPVLQEGHVHFPFNVLVSSGRTSSSGSDWYNSTNGQNLPRAAGVRECFVPPEGWLLGSCDYSGIELCSVAQTTYSLFGASVQHDLIQRGYDLHAYLGAVIAAKYDPAFSAYVEGKDREEVYRLFLALKTSPETAATYKKYRTMAKPTGLGYPGGLGPETFVEYAKATYGVTVTLQEATELRELWRKLYPEMPRYHEWVNRQIDPHNAGRYCYTTPMGMYRAGCTWSEAANGIAMQSPTAEGAKAAVFKVSRAMYDETLGDILFGSFLVDFIHDELLYIVRDDEHAHDKSLRISEIAVESMKLVMPDPKITAPPAHMRRWHKDAEAVYGTQGRLIPWEPRK